MIDTPQATLPGVTPIKRRSDAKHADRAAKQAAYRARKDLKAVTIQLPTALAERLDAWLAAKGKHKSETIARLIETQLLRPR
ncbi:hypothetical protein [Pseudoduganella sp. UC29_71]|uniref:hypothetical protein n=1 Tax=Pseudoduganella sp. UC29_71 TaxID=3350174 RepID=UPI00366BCD5F